MGNRFGRPGLWFLLLALLTAAGCGAAKPPLHPVRGQVFFQDKPAEGVLVLCHPVGGQLPPDAPLPPHGHVQADGSFTLSTYAEGDGAPAGEYVIVILEPTGEGEEGEEDGRRSRLRRLPETVGDAQTSPLRREVTPGDNVWAPFRLE